MEELRDQLRAAEEARDRLRGNMQFLKTKIIDTGQLVGLYQQAQTALKKEQEDGAAVRAQLATMRAQLSSAINETGPLREKCEQSQVSVDAMKLSLERKDTQLNSSKSLIEQLQADVADGNTAKKDRERLMKDLAKVKKDLIARDATIKELKEKNEEALREVMGLKGALAAALSERKKEEKRAAREEMEADRRALMMEVKETTPKRRSDELDLEISPVVRRQANVEKKADKEKEREKEREREREKEREKEMMERREREIITAKKKEPRAREKEAADDAFVQLKRTESSRKSTGGVEFTPPPPAVTWKAADEQTPTKISPMKEKISPSKESPESSSVWPSQEDDFGVMKRAPSKEPATLQALSKTKRTKEKELEETPSLKERSSKLVRRDPKSSIFNSADMALADEVPPSLKEADLPPLLQRLAASDGRDDASITSLASASPLHLSAAALSLLLKTTDLTQRSSIFTALAAVDKRQGGLLLSLSSSLRKSLFSSLRLSYASEEELVELAEKTRLSSCYALACKLLPDGVARIRVGYYDAMRLTTAFPSILLAAVEAWPVPIRTSLDPVVSPLVAAMRAVLYDQPTSDIVTALCKVSEWPAAEQDLDALAKTLFTEMLTHATSESHLPPNAFECMKALELVCVQRGWAWSYQTIVQDLCWPQVKRETASCKLIALYRLVGLVARLGNDEVGGSEETVVPALRTHITAWLTEDAPPGTKAAAAEAILDMGVERQHVTPVVNWFGHLHPSAAAALPQPLVDRLRTFLGDSLVLQ